MGIPQGYGVYVVYTGWEFSERLVSISKNKLFENISCSKSEILKQCQDNKM